MQEHLKTIAADKKNISIFFEIVLIRNLIHFYFYIRQFSKKIFVNKFIYNLYKNILLIIYKKEFFERFNLLTIIGIVFNKYTYIVINRNFFFRLYNKCLK